MPNDNYPWDPYSDQPHILRDKRFKRQLYRQGAGSSVKTLLYLFLLPFVALLLLFRTKYHSGQKVDNIGLCVNISDELEGQTRVSPDQIRELIDELGVRDILIRLPLAQMERFNDYEAFISRFCDKTVLVNVLQDRKHIEDSALLVSSLDRIYSCLGDKAQTFQIGNSINRRKWGFVSVNEYFDFYKIAQDLRDKKYPSLKLLGGNTIDFELPNFARSVFHASKLQYDGIATQLYVDRRGAPENSQFGFDLVAKIAWFYEMIKLSRKSKNKLYITETNWPLLGTEPYAPAVGDCMVDEEKQACYLVRYYLLAIASGKVEKCYWHQLVAPGYGLIDNRGSVIRKRKAFYCLKTLISLFDGASILSFEHDRAGYYRLRARNDRGTIQALWANDQIINVELPSGHTLLSMDGCKLSNSDDVALSLGDAPVFVCDYDAY